MTEREVLKCPTLSLLIGGGFFHEPLFDAILQEPKNFLDIGERGHRIVVVVHQAMIVVLHTRGNRLDDEPRLLHGCTAMLKFTCHLVRGLLQRTIQAKRFGIS